MATKNLNLFLTIVLLFQTATPFLINPFKSTAANSITCGCQTDQTPSRFSLTYIRPSYERFLQKTRLKRCSVTEKIIDEIDAELKKVVIGQNKAICSIRNHLATHLSHNSDVLKKTPLVLHFAGDFGVGKSLTASVISSSMFEAHRGKDTVEHIYTLLFSGSNYLARQTSETAKTVEARNEKIKQIRQEILSQIKRCSSSLIIINDLQKMDPEIFEKLEDIFEGTAFTDNGRGINTKNAFFIMTSDLGSADVSNMWGFNKLERMIKERFRLYVNFNKKLESLVVHKKPEMRQLFKRELWQKLSCHRRHECAEFSDTLVDFLIEKWEQSPVISKMNGRAFHKYIYPTFIENAIQRSINLDRKKFYARYLRLEIANERQNLTSRTSAENEDESEAIVQATIEYRLEKDIGLKIANTVFLNKQVSKTL